MRRANRLFAVQTLLLVNICFLGLGFAQRDKFLGGLIDYLNNLPNQPYVYEDGLLLTSHNAGDNVYNLEVSLKARDVQDPKSFKLLKCTATVQDNGDSGVTVLENEHHCHEDITQPPGPQPGAGGEDGGEVAGVTDAPIQEVPVKLDNEVQSDTAVTSGEQFVAIPRVVHNPPCIGCSSPVDPAAPGVRELALLGVRHLDRHDPNVRHNLKGVFEVERQVQVVNGVRYILTLNVDYNNCTTSETDACSSNKTCKISILEKPWVKLPDGSKFRAILANNCTENWLFGDDGEVLPPEDRNNEKTKINSINVHDDKDVQGTDEDFLKVVYQTNTQAKPATERTLSEHDLKLLEEQIIPNNDENTAEVPNIKVTKEPISVIQKKENTVQKELFLVQTKENVANNIHIDQIKKIANAKISTLSDQKKKDIDDLLSFLNYADFAPKQLEKEQSPRMKRSFDFDLKVLGLAEKFKNIKKQVADARTVTELAKFLVNYMNEMDIQMKTRELKDVLKAEEEFDNDQQFVYIQVRVYTPCGEMGCDINDDVTNICNAIIDNSVSKYPKILNHFCYEEKLKDPFHGKVTEIPLDDPVLQYLVEDVLKKIEAESDIPNAINLRVLQANTRQTVGIVTEMITENVYTNCNKTVPHSLRDNCTALKNVGSKVCEVVIMDRSWLNEKQISYTCTKRGVDEQVTTESSKKLRGNIKDPEILAMAHLALRQLEELSNIDYRQKVVDVTKVSTQLIAGLLTNLEFDVGYTTCSHTDSEIRLEDCKLVKGMPLRKCEAQIWDRSWLIDGKQVKVSCDDTSTVSNDLNNNEIFRKKRDVGEETEQDSDKEEYQRLAIDAMNTYVQQSGDWTSSVTNNRRYGEMDPKDPRYQVLAEDALQVFVTREKLSSVWKVAEVNQVSLSSMQAHNPYNDTHIFFTISNNEGVSRSCRALIFYMNNKKRIRIRCSPTQTRHLVGAVQLMNPNAQKYQILAKESLEKYAKETKLSGVWRVDEVTKVTYQIISGSLTQLDFTISNMGASIPCHSQIWEQPWLNKKDITVNCQLVEETDKTIMVRGKENQDSSDPKYKVPVIGGEEEKTTNKKKYKRLAKEAMEKYLKQTCCSNAQVIQVLGVTTQLVEGLKTKIDFEILQDDSLILICHASILEQSWLNKKDITVTCSKSRKSAGTFVKDPSKPKYMELAKKSMNLYFNLIPKMKGGGAQWTLFNVTNVSNTMNPVNWLSGYLIDLYFKVNNTGSTTVGKVLSCHTKIWAKPWLKREDIFDVECGLDSRRKREIVGGLGDLIQLVGGQTEQDPTNSKYLILAKQGLDKYAQQSGTTAEVTKLLHVTTQVVAGVKTVIDFEILQNGTVNLICKTIVLEQSWLNNTDIATECQETEREKHQVPGGKTKLDPKDPKYRMLAEKSLQKHVSQKVLSGVWKVAEVTEVTTQVVSGILTEIAFNSVENGGQLLSCKSTIRERPWLNEEEITVDCTEAARKKRRVVGGLTEKDPNDPIYQVLAEESLQKHVSQNGLAGVWKVAEVTKVTYQVVAGSMTKIDFNTAENGGQVLFCHSKVWEQPWLNKKEITVNCQEIEREKRQLPGGKTKLEPNDPKYQILAEKSLQKHVSQKGLSGVWKVAEVTEVTTQVVSGISTEIAFNSVGNGGQLLFCKSTIRERPWLNEEEITVDCTETGRQKREVSGGSVEKEKEKEHKQLAEEALKKYDKDSNSKYSHRVLKLRHVYQYNVSEHVTAIEFTMATTKCVRADEQKKVNCDVDTSTIPFICQAVIEKKDNDSRMFTQCTEKKALQKKNIFSANEHVEKSTDKSRVVTPPITSDARFKRQIRPDDFEIDDDVKFIYAEKALEQLNLRSDTQNMQKLVAIHSVATSMQMGTLLVRMYIEVGYTFCLKQNKPSDMAYCDEMDGLNHRLCLVKIYPTPEDDTIVKHVATVCDDEADFEQSSGLNVLELIKISLNHIEEKDNLHYKLVHQGEANLVPSLDTSEPIKLSFIVATTNCSKNDVDDIYDYRSWQENLQRKDCVVLESIHPQGCSSFIWMSEKTVKHVKAICRSIEAATRLKRSTNSIDAKNSTSATVEELVNESIHKLEMTNIYKFKQRVLQINSFNTKITTGQLTTIDFDVGYTSCLKYEWVDDISKCEFLEHLPRRHCVSMIYERLWISNGRRIHVNCEDDETPLEVHTEFENAQLATSLAEEALKHIEFKYPHPQRQKVVRIFSVDKQTIAGLHYRIKLEVGFTDCLALSVSTDCNFVKEKGENKFCRANIWVRPWTEHPPIVRVTCDYQEAATTEIYHQVQAEHLFYDFIITHKPSYSSDPIEMRERFQIFKANLRRIQELNTRERGTARYAVTQFADLSYEEFSSKYLGLKPGLRHENQVSRASAHIPDHEIPDSFDWRDHGAVTPVKNQGSCGSCWAFSVIGNIEGQYKLRAGKLLSLSEQELVDCDTLDEGCNGGMPDNAYRAIETLGGLETEDDYPYEGENDKCTFNKTLTRVQLSGAVNISSNETDMAKWLVQNGPISIAINANAMQFYVGGISHPWRMLCNPNNLDHGVLIVGYGVKTYPLFHKTLPYWIVKNSWGASWGEQGYYRVFRGDGTCGLNTLASSAIVATPNDE